MNLSKSISAVQNELVGILKKSSDVKERGYKYQKLEHLLEILLPILVKNGLILSQPLCGNGIKTIIRHIETGEEVSETFSMPFTYEQQYSTKVDKNGVSETKPAGQTVLHQWGSAMTYGRRYGIVSILGIHPDEDKDASDVVAVHQATRPTLIEEGLGNCQRCGAPNKLSGQGNAYCSNLCWK